MTFFEVLLLLMLVATILLQLARRLSLPYPAMLAGAGVVLAFLPGIPVIPIDPETFLALFIAPVLVDAAYDFPPGATRRFIAPLLTFAVFAVLLTAASIAWLAHAFAGLPWVAGLALGAIIAPPDAAAASAVLRGLSLPKNVNAIMQGESLFNDSTALLLFSTALALLSSHAIQASTVLRLGAAVPGGVLLGIVCAYGAKWISRFASGTLGGNLLQFIMAYGVWIFASHLQLSAVLATVAFAMTLARNADTTGFGARMRVQSYAVWSAVVFTLNVFAFMLMGMQARLILRRMNHTELHGALMFAVLVVASIIVVRMLIVLPFHRVYNAWQRAFRRPQTGSLQQAAFVGWCGMRGFVTMATALALPANFPRRDLAVLTAFVVVLATLILQGLTLAPMIRLLKINSKEDTEREAAEARTTLAQAALASLREENGPEAENLRYRFRLLTDPDEAKHRHLRNLGLRAAEAQRMTLEELRAKNKVSIEDYLNIQEQTDWFELTMLEESDRQIEEI